MKKKKDIIIFVKHNEIHDVGRKNVCVKNICGTKKKLTKTKNMFALFIQNQDHVKTLP